MRLSEYAENFDRYYDFAEYVKNILEEAIKVASRDGTYKYHLLQILYRAKSLESLTDRLREKGNENANNIEVIRGDLAGCCVIFYYNNDVNVFIESGLIYDLFEIDRNKTQFHGPLGKVKSANDEYTAIHYLVQLKKDNPEYARFGEMKCEVQVQTVLNHAFSETIHDILYKKPTTKNFGSQALKSIDKLMQKIMKDYLKPAGHQLQNVKNDQQRLLDGKILFDRSLKDEIVLAGNNNDRYELLNKFCENTLPLCDDEYFEQETDSIIDIVENVVKVSQYVDPTPIRIPSGAHGETKNLEGKTFKDVLLVSMEILFFIRYINPKKIFSCMIKCYQRVDSDDEKELIQEYILKLVEYRVEVLKSQGIVVQEIVLNQVESATSEVIQIIKPAAIAICEAILNPTAEGTSSSYETITLIQGCLPGNEAVSSLRDRSIKLLVNFYNHNLSEREKIKIYTALYQASRLPNRGGCSAELMEIVLRDSIDLISFYTSLIPNENYKQLSAIEKDVIFLHNRSQSILTSKREFSEGCMEVCKEIVKSALNFRDVLNLNDEFVVYKTLVGYRSVFQSNWTNDKWGYEEEQEYRKNNAREYVPLVENNKEYWKGLILKCAATQSNEGASFTVFDFFLKLLARSNPDFVMDLLNNNEDELSDFIPVILNGLLNSELRDVALQKIMNWVVNGNQLYNCALSYRYDQPFNQEILKLILEKAIELQDNIALRGIIFVIPNNFMADNEFIVQDIFIPALEAMINLNDAGWIDGFYYQINSKRIISSLDERDIEIVLKSMLSRPKIDYHAEAILTPIAQKYPNKIYEYFSNRISFYKEHKQTLRKYEPIPYDDFVDLLKPLGSYPNLAIVQMKSWYDDDPDKFLYRGARLIQKIFPDFPSHFEAELKELIRSGRDKDLQMVIILLRLYKGAPAIIDLCKEIIKQLPDGSVKLDEIMKVLDQTGVLTGDYGSVAAFEEKIQQISPWLEDLDRRVAAFAERYTEVLEMRAKHEQLRADEAVEQMKHQYGDDETE